MSQTQQPKKYNQLAIIGFLLTILGIIICLIQISPIIGGLSILIGAILGKMALYRIKSTGENGKGLAMFSFVIGILLVILVIISMILLYVPLGL